MTLTSISSTAYNTLETDIGTEITNSLDRLGRSAMQAALPMGNNKITGMADPTVATDGSTKNYVDTTTAAFFSTGDVKLTLKTVADTGWLLFDDGTFGSGSSSSSNRANADTQSLFNLLYALSDANAPILTSGGGATTRAAQGSASAAWAANCRMTLPKTLGRALGVAGAGSGLTARTLGSAIGTETASLSTANLPPYTPSGSVSTSSSGSAVTQGSAGGSLIPGVAAAIGLNNTGTAALPIGVSSSSTFTGSAQGGTSTAFSIMQPETFFNAMVKL